MKKILLPLMAVAALLTACDEERYDAPQFQKGVTFTVPDFIEEAGTRVAVSVDNEGAHFTWTEGDTLGVFPSNGYQTAFPISGGAGTNTAIFDGADWALRPNASYAAYYPFVYEIKDKTAIEASYLGQTQDGNGSTAHLGNYDYLAAKYNTVSASGDVNFTLNHLGCLVRFQLTMPEADTYTSMTLSCEGSMLTTAGKFDLTAATPALTVKRQNVFLTLGLNNIATTEANQVLTLYMMLPPMDLGGKNLTIKIFGEKNYEATIDGKNMKAGSIYGYSNIMTQYHEYVDLGLPSGTMWATCNVGANKPEEFGDYFAWGETEPYYTEGHAQDNPCSNWKSGKSGYNWASYKYCQGAISTHTKYCTDSRYGTIDNKTVLEAADDAATANWGGDWRMPTYAELDELQNNCTWTWTTLNGVNGYNVVGPNGNSIFLPAAGYRDFSSLYHAGSNGYYWSSSLSTSYPYNAYYLYFNSDGFSWRNSVRYYGFSVRPVCPNPDFIRVSSIQITGEKTQLALSETLQLSATVAPSDATNASVTWSSSNEPIANVSADGLVTAFATGFVTITATANDGSGVKGEYEITVSDPYNGHEYVDLGLTSNGKPIYWATCNVGATKPEEYGDYFAWGETEPYYTAGHSQDNPCSNWKSGKSNGYDWPSYKYCNGSYDSQTKYCTSFRYGTVDNKTVLDAADDAATANWGGSWRTPTRAEQDELRTKCTWTWTSKNGVNGYNVVGPNGNSIFLPAAGSRYDSGLLDAGSFGEYWSSSLDTSRSDYAYCLCFYSDFYDWSGYDRYIGLSVRPVCR